MKPQGWIKRWSSGTFESCLLALSCWRMESNCTCVCTSLCFCSAASCCAACFSACRAATCCWRDRRRCRKTAWDFDILFLVFCRETPEGGGGDTMLHSVSVHLLLGLNCILSNILSKTFSHSFVIVDCCGYNIILVNTTQFSL